MTTTTATTDGPPSTAVDDDEDDDDEQYRQEASARLFAREDEDEDDNQVITQHTWSFRRPTLDDDDDDDDTPTIITITYHLALLAHGHGDSLWNAGPCVAEWLFQQQQGCSRHATRQQEQQHDENINMKDNSTFLLWNHLRQWPPEQALELGAGSTALPSLVLFQQGAKHVVCTDKYQHHDTFDALERSFSICREQQQRETSSSYAILPHTWGKNMEELLLEDEEKSSEDALEEQQKQKRKFDLIVASDCIYNPQYHRDLLKSAVTCLHPNHGMFVVAYSLHGNVRDEQVMEFFTLAAESEFNLQILAEWDRHYPGQYGIGGHDPVRGTVHVQVLAYATSRYFQAGQHPP